MLKKLFRLAALLALVATIVWLTREHLLPTPRVADDPRPHFRSTPPAPEAAPDDLTKVKGIGPVYAERLAESGITTYEALVGADAAAVADVVGTTEDAVAGWIAQAKAL